MNRERILEDALTDLPRGSTPPDDLPPPAYWYEGGGDSSPEFADDDDRPPYVVPVPQLPEDPPIDRRAGFVHVVR